MLVNMVYDSKQCSEQIVNMGLVDLIVESVISKEESNVLAILSHLLISISKAFANTSRLMTQHSFETLLSRLRQLTNQAKGLEFLSFISKSRVDQFSYGSSSDKVILLNQYCAQYPEAIAKRFGTQNYKQAFFAAMLFLKFVAAFHGVVQ